MSSEREQPSSQPEQGSQDARPNKYGIKGKLLQFRQPIHTYLKLLQFRQPIHTYPVREGQQPPGPGYALVPLSRNEGGASSTGQPAGSSSDLNAAPVAPSPLQAPAPAYVGQAAPAGADAPYQPQEPVLAPAYMGQAAPAPARVPSQPQEPVPAQWQEQARGGPVVRSRP